ncbi:MAG TPA: thioredoxin family protein, partial [Gemmatimonadales bacterium]
YQLARVPPWAIADASLLGMRFRLVVIAEDWCGDATNTVPVLARWAELTTNVELRVLRRDQHPDVMDHYLTGGTARSIPVVIVLTESMEELGWWGPRPKELQAWTMAQRAAGRDKKALYPEIRRWYAKDKGETTLREVLAVMGPAREVVGVPS